MEEFYNEIGVDKNISQADLVLAIEKLSVFLFHKVMLI
jgi:hypothetical protein